MSERDKTIVSSDVGVDIQDDMGRHEVGYIKDTVKAPYGEGGCNFQTVFQINKVLTGA